MRLVIDTNMIISALVRDGKCREIITSNEFEFLSPEFVLEEIDKYKKYILEKSDMSEHDYLLLIEFIFSKIKIVVHETYENKLKEAEKIMEEDKKDAPFVACYLSLNCDGIWTNDSDYDGKKELKLFSTKDLIDIIEY